MNIPGPRSGSDITRRQRRGNIDMHTMTKRERVLATIEGREVDRIPLSMWYHLPQFDQDPIALAEEQIRLAKLYGLDFIKMMPFGNYVAQDYGLSVDFFCTKDQAAFERKFGIASVEEWKQLEPLPATYGTYGKQLQLSQQMNKRLKEDIPYIQTIFTPLTVAKKLAGPRVFEDMRSFPDYLHQALEAITQTTINFVKANIEAGVSGFFLATQCATSDYITLAEHKEFGEAYDLKVIESFANVTPINILHIHGTNTYFEELTKYPVNCLNWHDRWAGPSMTQARKLTDKCLVGGINEKWLEHARYEEVGEHLHQAVEEAGRTKLILAPGCCIEMDTPEINLMAVSVADRSL